MDQMDLKPNGVLDGQLMSKLMASKISVFQLSSINVLKLTSVEVRQPIDISIFVFVHIVKRKKKGINSPIHTFKIDGEILPAELLYSNNRGDFPTIRMH